MIEGNLYSKLEDSTGVARSNMVLCGNFWASIWLASLARCAQFLKANKKNQARHDLPRVNLLPWPKSHHSRPPLV